MALIWIAFITSAVLVAGAAWQVWRRANGGKVADFAGRPLPWQWDAMALFLGAIGVVSTVPGLFFGQPHWAIDHVWRVISKISGNAG